MQSSYLQKQLSKDQEQSERVLSRSVFFKEKYVCPNVGGGCPFTRPAPPCVLFFLPLLGHCSFSSSPLLYGSVKF
ncbi:hypothetical protein VIGAN_01166500 [Vigna angularis var. angularis]|uniref:Uncharacterized protein n=1 Tax=Vigna angularis var. angularis TaxID=157739 RepID=A0A0S3R0H3_PHAAN|nr:hypothetical protein VIGAN_01166500 [Vigna angularis var. angularis]